MGRVGRALVLHEFLERIRDRWVLVITLVFAVLAGGIALYGRSAGDAAGLVTAPSLVTLAAFLVPLVALVLLAKYMGRGIALCLAIGIGFGTAAFAMGAGQRGVLLSLVPSTLLLGTSFLSVGILISTVAQRHATAASLSVVTWFGLVFFYDLALLVAMVATDGALSQDAVAWLVSLNPAGLYRLGLMTSLVGEGALEELGMVVALPGSVTQASLWAAWIAGPLAVGALLLSRRRAVTA
ncbi:MAG: ABC transporter permease [Deltaproteobacteria bacterium]|nr:ABC transporter permease [Deltaproteobacteria bacterium]